MNEDVREFYVSNAVTGESGMMTAIGRGGRAPIPVGTVFKVAYKEKLSARGEPLPEHPQRERFLEIELRVVEVSAYGKRLDALPGNTTGCLVFPDADLNHAPPGWVLSES